MRPPILARAPLLRPWLAGRGATCGTEAAESLRAWARARRRSAFRVDASSETGLGHLFRCRTLAETLRDRGGSVEFICRQLPGHQASLLSDAGFRVQALPAPPAATAALEGDYGHWLGVSQDEDATQTDRWLSGTTADWLIVDQYALDARWEGQLRARTRRLMVIDDLANRQHDCDLLLDQNPPSSLHERYQGLTPAHCEHLLGVRFALMRPQYRARRRSADELARPIRRVFVFFGGSDPHNLTGLVLEALSHASLRRLHVDIVAGPNYQHGTSLAELAAARPGTTLHGPRPHLADPMAEAALGHRRRRNDNLGALVRGTSGAGCEHCAESGASRRGARAARADQLSGQGGGHDRRADRPCRANGHRKRHSAGRAVASRPAAGGWPGRSAGGRDTRPHGGCPTAAARRDSLDDVGVYFAWANDPQVRRQSFNSAAIGWEAHECWFAERLLDAHLLVLEAHALAVGQVRFDQDGDQLRIDYSIDAQFRGRGWGRALVVLGMRRMAGLGHPAFIAEVKPGNAASLAIFERLGFRTQAGLDPTQPHRLVYDVRKQGMPGTD